MAQPLTIIARVRAKPGQQARLRQVLLALVPPTRAEAGCINYDLHQSVEDPTLFVFQENWATEADFEAHARSPHVEASRKIVPELTEGRVEITKWKRVT